jgi:hypothetical protein
MRLFLFYEGPAIRHRACNPHNRYIYKVSKILRSLTCATFNGNTVDAQIVRLQYHSDSTVLRIVFGFSQSGATSLLLVLLDGSVKAAGDKTKPTIKPY